MSAPDRALSHLAQSGAVLAPERNGKSFGVFAKGDRRRRPKSSLGASEVRALEASGAIVRGADANCFVISKAGRARVARDASVAAEAFVAQHRPIVPRTVIDADGAQRSVRGHDAAEIVRKLAAMRDVGGKPWFSVAELDAAATLRSAWELGAIGLVAGSDLTAPPRGSTARGAGNAAEHLIGAQCDARACVAASLNSLAPPLRHVVEAVCLAEEGLELIERREAWPTRSAKLALKFALAQLAANRG